MLDQNLECWSGVAEMEKSTVPWVSKVVSVDTVVLADMDEVVDMARQVVAECLVE